MLCQTGEDHYRQQAPGLHFHERCGNIITEATAYPIDWLSRQNHAENRDEEITGLQLNINVIDIETEAPT